MPRSLKIKWASSRYRLHEDDGVRIRIETVCSNGVDQRVFAYRMLPINNSGTTAGFFSHICSPVDMTEYPADEPRIGEAPEWFRLSFVDVFLRSLDEANDFVDVVRSDIRRLLNTLNKMDTVLPGGEESIGQDCDPPTSSDSSSSAGSEEAESLGGVQTLTATGTTEQSTGSGVAWQNIGSGAGSPVGSSDSFGASRSRVVLQTNESSQLLLVQGFNFTDLPDNVVITGIQSQLILADTTNPPHNSQSNSSESYSAATCATIKFLALQHPAIGNSSNRAPNHCVDTNWYVITTGNDNDQWGFTSITSQHLKDGAFGVGLIIKAGDTSNTTVEVDGVQLTVFYREVL